MIITFVGHSIITEKDSLSNQLTQTIKAYLDTGKPCTFYCGGYGDFDRLCARCLQKMKSDYTHYEVIYVTPYMTESQQKKMKFLLASGLYDDTLYPPLEHVPNKFAISKRNEWMVTQSDLIIAYVTSSFGGAFKTLEFAYRKKKTIINLANLI